MSEPTDRTNYYVCTKCKRPCDVVKMNRWPREGSPEEQSNCCGAKVTIKSGRD